MTITLQANDFTINALGGVLDSRNPSGTPPNQAPVWATVPTQTVQAGSTVALSSYSSDPNGDALTYQRVGGTAPAGVTVNASTGLVTVPAGTAAGTYTVIVRASDGSLTADRTVSIVVTTPVVGVPAISSFSGAVAHGNTLVINGSSFGVRAEPRPLLWVPADGSMNPSPLGVMTAWTETQSVQYAAGEGAFGGGAIKASDSSGSWVAGIIAPGVVWNAYGQRMYCFRRVKQNFEITPDLNWKIIRFWPAAITTPDWFIQAGNANLNVEGIDGSDTYPYDPGITSPISGGNIAAVRGTANVWKTEEILMRANSAAAAYDGQFYHYVLGAGLVGVLPHTTYQAKTIRLRSSDAEPNMTMAYPVHAVRANVTFPSHYRHWTDDVYLDSYWSRVMIGNAATYSACTDLHPQPASAWANDQVAVSLNIDKVPSGQPMYLFVVSESNVASAGHYVGVSP